MGNTYSGIMRCDSVRPISTWSGLIPTEAGTLTCGRLDRCLKGLDCGPVPCKARRRQQRGSSRSFRHKMRGELASGDATCRCRFRSPQVSRSPRRRPGALANQPMPRVFRSGLTDYEHRAWWQTRQSSVSHDSCLTNSPPLSQNFVAEVAARSGREGARFSSSAALSLGASLKNYSAAHITE